jgi:hypothetical protein
MTLVLAAAAGVWFEPRQKAGDREKAAATTTPRSLLPLTGGVSARGQ